MDHVTGTNSGEIARHGAALWRDLETVGHICQDPTLPRPFTDVGGGPASPYSITSHPTPFPLIPAHFLLSILSPLLFHNLYQQILDLQGVYHSRGSTLIVLRSMLNNPAQRTANHFWSSEQDIGTVGSVPESVMPGELPGGSVLRGKPTDVRQRLLSGVVLELSHSTVCSHWGGVWISGACLVGHPCRNFSQADHHLQ